MVDPENKGESFASLFERSGTAGLKRRYRVGERVEVTVVAVGKDAVFADLGAKEEGYFDKPELAGPDGQLGVTIGATISAVIAAVDDASGQLRLSPVFVRRAAGGDAAAPIDGDLGVAIPVARSGPLLVEGARVKGAVTGIERYGVFVQITGTNGRGGRGLVPTPETGTPRGADLKKHFTVGQEVETKILNIAEDGKIRLSISALKADEERGEFEAYAREERTGKPAGGAPGGAPSKPAPRGFGTLGDLLGGRSAPAAAHPAASPAIPPPRSATIPPPPRATIPPPPAGGDSAAAPEAPRPRRMASDAHQPSGGRGRSGRG